MKIRYVKAVIELSECQSTVVIVPAWEFEVLRAIHTRNDPNILDDNLQIDRELPEINDEFKRLQDRYRRLVDEEGRKGAFWVEAVYSNDMSQRGRFARALNDAVVADDADSTLDDLLRGPDDGEGLGGDPNETVSSVGG